MAYWRLFYHVVWATKFRRPVLTPEVEALAHQYVRAKAIGLGATVFAVNGMPDHIHLVVSIPPTIAVAHFVGQVKGVSSVHLNRAGLGRFAWQDAYSVFSCDERGLSYVVSYVQRQKEHHASRTTRPALEVPHELVTGTPGTAPHTVPPNDLGRRPRANEEDDSADARF